MNNLPWRAVPREELEICGQRVIEDAAGDEVGYIIFDEDAEDVVRAVNAYPALLSIISELLACAELNYDDPLEAATAEVVTRAHAALEKK